MGGSFVFLVVGWGLTLGIQSTKMGDFGWIIIFCWSASLIFGVD